MTLGAYEIIAKLSDDGNRVLYRALDPKTGDRVLIRVLQERARFASDAFFLRNEFEMLSDPALQGCVRALALENLDGYPALVMADPAAGTLRQRMEALGPGLPERVLLALRIAESLSALHAQGVIHKNINPVSILIQEETGEILLSDFGLAERIGQHREASFIGACTPEYASPEQTGRTSLALDYRSDIYSLGVVFYELFCGRRPFQAEDINGLMYAHLTQTPSAPRKVNRELPEALDEILLKMLEKEPDNRYQSVQGLLPDLEWVRDAVGGQRRDVFILGRQDVPVRFVEPQKPYGKQPLMDLLAEERSRISAGRNRLILLKGEAGSGKSYLLQTLYRGWVGESGTVLYVDLSGISDQAPYSALRQALEAYAENLLTGPAEKLRRFRSQLERSLVPSLRQLGDLFPSLSRLFQDKPEAEGGAAADSLPPLDRQILLLAEALLGFDPPITVLADSLDRIDKESYHFLIQFVRNRNPGGFMLVGTVTTDLLEASELADTALLREGTFSFSEYTVPEYAPEDVQLYLRDAFKLSVKKAGALSRLIYSKTDGNPHHTAAFIRRCCQKGWLFFNTAFGEWDFKAGEIERYQTAANVTNRALDRLKQLGDSDLELLKAAAVMGFEFDPEALAHVVNLSRDTVQSRLGEAMAQGLLAGRYGAEEAGSGSRRGRIRFRFSHESVYLQLLALAEDSFRIRVAFTYGQALAQGDLATTDELGLYLSHMNSAVALIRPEERPMLAQRNLEYAIRLKRIGVLERALHHAEFGLSLLDQPHFDEKDPLSFRLTLERAELAYLNRQFSEAEAFFDALIGNCTVPVNRAKAIRTKMTLYINQGKMRETLALAAEALAALDVPFDGAPSDIVVGRELLRYNALILGKRIEDMESLPVSTDTRVYLITEIYMTLISVSYLVGKNLFIYVILRILNLTLKHGLTMHSSYAFSIYGLIAGSALGNPWKGVAYGSLGIRLAERFGSQDMLGKCLFTYGFFLNHWVNHPRTNLPPLQRAIELTEATGDMIFHAYSVAAYILAQMDSGVPLSEILRTIGAHFDRIHALHVEDVFNLLVLLRQTVFALQGQTDSPASFNAVDFDEALFEQKLKASSMQSIYAVYLVQKLKLNYLYGQYRTADSLCAELQSYTQELMGLSVFPEYYQYYSLTLLELEGALQTRTRTLYRNQRHLSGWMQHAPQNFRHRYLTVQGVWQLKRGQAVKAVATLTEALQLAQKQGFLQEEALINELLGRCHEQLNQAMIRRMYLKNAYALYKQWGGLVKMKALKEAHSDILFEEGYEAGGVGASLSAGLSAGAQGHMADLLSVFKSAQTLSSEMHPHELFKRLLAIIRENAGAQRTVILMKQGDIVPVAWSTEAGIFVAAEGSPEPCEYAETVVNQAVRTGETVIVEDVSKLAYLRKDPHVIKHSPVSLMCTPIHWKGALMGLLYLENNRIAGAFSWSRLEVMQVLTAQFVISYDNALLYESLRHSEAELKNHKYKLERIVEERTAELSRANFEIQLLLDHAGQGFFSFDRTERIGSELSRECTRIFGRTISGLKVSELLGSCCSPEEGALLSRVIDKAFQTSDVFQARVYLSLLPQQLQVQEKAVAVEYQMIEDFDSRRVMAILTDVTETQALMKSREEEKRQLKTIVKIVQNRNSFLRSLEDYQQFAEQGCLRLAEAGADAQSVLTELFRVVHTFKGDFAQWGLIHTEQALHEIETLIADQRSGTVSALEVSEFIEDLEFEKAVEKDLELLEAAFGKSFLQKGEHFEISRAEILNLEALARAGDPEALSAGIRALRLVNIKELLAPYDDYITTMAFALEKKVNPLRITGADVLIDRKHYYNFIRVLVHVFRNMMDYGIEQPETRAKAGKPEAGTIYCAVARGPGETVVLEVEDDGSGISPQQLLEVLVKNAPDQRALFSTYDDDALLQTIFSDGVSTGDDVTLLSGRGIGLSAVRTEVERLGGSIRVSSRIGFGTAFTITLPLID